MWWKVQTITATLVKLSFVVRKWGVESTLFSLWCRGGGDSTRTRRQKRIWKMDKNEELSDDAENQRVAQTRAPPPMWISSSILENAVPLGIQLQAKIILLFRLFISYQFSSPLLQVQLVIRTHSTAMVVVLVSGEIKWPRVTEYCIHHNILLISCVWYRQRYES